MAAVQPDLVQDVVFGVTAIVVGFILMAFAQWLYYHFVFEARTGN